MSHVTRRRLLTLLPALAAAPSVPVEAAPGSLNLNAASKYVAGRRGLALLVKEDGKVVFEKYYNGAKEGEVRRIYSGTKGFWGLAAMAAIEDGKLTPGEKVSATLASWREGAKKDVTLEQLLDFTGGLERCLRLHQDGLKNRNQMAVDRPLVAKPGNSFIYGPSQLQVFHEVLKQKLKGRFHSETPTHYLERRVLHPLGLGTQRYLPDASGNPLLAAGFVMTPDQWARMGDLILAGGRPVLKSSSMKLLLEGSSANGAYSFGFWNNRSAGLFGREIDIEDHLQVDWNRQNWSRVCFARRVPSDAVACIGSGYQRLYAIPSRKLVVVRQGLNARFSDGEFLRTLLG